MSARTSHVPIDRLTALAFVVRAPDQDDQQALQHVAECERCAAQLARLHPESARWLECCTDLGRRALNTAGNAVETRQWVRRNGFDTVIVVTSGWHMQRSLLEVQRAIPETILIPYPVDARNGADDGWWSQPGNFRLLVAEYIKYLAALIEVRIAPPTGNAPSQKQKS